MESSSTAKAERRPLPCSAVPGIVRRLAEIGVRAAITGFEGRYTAGGALVRLSFSAENAERTEGELGLAFRALRAGVPVTALVADFADGAAHEQALAVAKRFRRFVAAAGVDVGLLNLCLSANDLPPGAFRAALGPLLGDGPRYLMLPARDDVLPSSNRPPIEESVRRLIHAPAGRRQRFWPALPAVTRSRCSLLPGEASRTLLPTFGIAAPAGSAWLPLSLDIGRISDAEDGAALERRLESTLTALVDLGDRLLDELVWLDSRQAADARQNRRLAISIFGFGDLIVRRGDDPSNWDTLKWLDRLIARLHAALWRRSRELAARRGALPALTARAPTGRWRDEAHRRAWRERWHAALAAERVRHRNLLVLSPYAVLPRSKRPTPEFADLLPALLHADAFCFSSPPSLERWTAADLGAFYGRLQALIDRRNAASFVAAGV